MKQVFDQLEKIQFDHALWVNELTYAIIEIELYQNRVISLLEENLGQKVEEKLLALFENFEKKKELVNEIKLNIRIHHINNSKLVSSNGNIQKMVNIDHQKTEKEMEDFRNGLKKLKEDFNRFLILNGI